LKTTENYKQKQILLKAIVTHSPMSWAHINLLGEYDFSDEKMTDSFGIKTPKMWIENPIADFVPLLG